MTILVTGGCGFIGSNFINNWMNNSTEKVINLDLLTYAGYSGNIQATAGNSNYLMLRGDIGNRVLVEDLLNIHKPRAILNFAAESHVDRSISGPQAFIQSNIVGCFNLLSVTLDYWNRLPKTGQDNFRFLHVSTDEVYGSLKEGAPSFHENHPYAPNSPYSASKASSDHLVRSFFHTYKLPTLTTNCSNNFGPYQFPEKLIPLTICNAITDKELPVYGDGRNIRDWLYVVDHCQALQLVLESGTPGEVYNIGGDCEIRNIDIVKSICKILDEISPRNDSKKYSEQIKFVEDRKGHDWRYAINSEKIKKELGWQPKETFAAAIQSTVKWYLSNIDWCDTVRSNERS